MFRFIVILIFSFLLSASAVFQYSIIEGEQGKRNDGGDGNGIYGRSFSVLVTEGSGALYIVDKVNNLGSMDGARHEMLASNVDMSVVGNYGWVDVSTGLSHSGLDAQIVLYDENVTQTGYALGNFSAGDEIGIWLRPIGHEHTGASVFHKDNAINSSEINYRAPFTGRDALGYDLFHLSFTSAGPIFFSIYGDENHIVGQPLPGVIGTMAMGVLALCSAGGARRRKQIF